MSAELLINVTPQETRVALIENGVLQEILIERTHRRGLVGNIYKGRVCRVLPGMQAAFVDIGLQRAAFLHASDVAQAPVAREGVSGPPPPELSAGSPAPEQDGTPQRANGTARGTDITRLLREGQEVLVQVIKDPIGSKGARLTTHVSIPACYLVLMPGTRSIGVSQRIDDEEERLRLRELCAEAAGRLHPATPEGASLPARGYIVRTAAEGVLGGMLAKDMEFLDRLWASLEQRADGVGAPAIVHEDLSLVLRTLRELTGASIERIRIDSRESVRRVIEFTQSYLPELTSRIEHYGGERPIFELYSVEDEIQKALHRKVQLKSGGHLILDQTEAMTTIDVNTGAYVGHRNLEETIFKTNLEAAHISSVSALGLVEMTRKRTRESLERVLCEPCPTCNGRGTIKAPHTVCYEIFRDILRESRQFDTEKLLVLASPEVIDILVDDESASFAELEAFIGKPITLQAESQYPREQYDVVLM
jgi:ribonuclease G